MSKAFLDLNLQLEDELLLAFARTNVNKKNIEKLLESKGINWDSFLRKAYSNKVLPLLYFHFKSINSDLIPLHYLSVLASHCERTVKSNLLLTSELLKILRLLKTENICVVPFKGPILTTSIYKNLSLRDFCDLDLLINEDDFCKVKNILKKDGYEPEFKFSKWQEESFLKYHYESMFKNTKDTHLDIHWRVVPTYFNETLKSNELINDSVEIELFGEKIRTLSPEDMLIVLCFNGAKDSWRELKMLTDVAELIQSCDLQWEKVLQKSKKLKVEKILALGVVLANSLYQVQIPEEVLIKVQTDSSIKLLAEKVCSSMFNGTPQFVNIKQQSLFHLKVLDNYFQKIKYCIDFTLTPTIGDWQFLSLPKYFSWLYCFIRPIRLIKKYLLKFFRSGKLVGFVSTHKDIVEQMLEFAEVGEDDVIYDLGCGDGRFIIAAAKKYGCKGVGIDIDPENIKNACSNAKKEGVEKLTTFLQADALGVDISEATVVILFLPPSVVKAKFKKELKPETLILSYGNYYFKGCTPFKTKITAAPSGSMYLLYLWKVDYI